MSKSLTKPSKPDRPILGLESKVVRLVEHQPGWTEMFAKEQVRLTAALQALGLKVTMRHVGSTALNEIPAKPIIDTLVEFSDLRSLRTALAAATELGLKVLQSPGNGDDFLLSKGEPAEYYHHFTRSNSVFSKNAKRITRALRRQHGLRKEYAAAKQELAVKFPDSRINYTRSKQDFLGKVLIRQTFADEIQRAMRASMRRGDVSTSTP